MSRPPVSWKNLARAQAPLTGLQQSTTDSGRKFLMQWGPAIQFEVWPLNYHEMDHETATDWAHKEIAGAAVYREWVGENDELIFLRGRVYPYRLGGMSECDMIESQRRGGIANPLIRGDGRTLGWFVVEKFIRSHVFISSEGVGRMISFEASFARVPVPDNTSYFASVWQTIIPV